MKSYTATALSIAFRIWFIAVIVNTIGNAILFGGVGAYILNAVLVIVLFSGLFSAPVFLTLWAVIYYQLDAGKEAASIFKVLLLIGICLAIATWAVFAYTFSFFDNELAYMAAIAALSGAIAICAAYPNIKKACLIRDQNNTLPKFDAEQTVAA